MSIKLLTTRNLAHNWKMSSNDYDRESIRSSEYRNIIDNYYIASSNRSRSRDDVRSKNASR